MLLALADQIGLQVDELDQALILGRYSKVLAEHDSRFAELQVEWVPTVFYEEKKILEGAFSYEAAEIAIQNILDIGSLSIVGVKAHLPTRW